MTEQNAVAQCQGCYETKPKANMRQITKKIHVGTSEQFFNILDTHHYEFKSIWVCDRCDDGFFIRHWGKILIAIVLCLLFFPKSWFV